MYVVYNLMVSSKNIFIFIINLHSFLHINSK